MLIASAGCWTWGFLFDWTKASAKERLPILPQYIRRMMINRDTGCNALVIPVVIPTVPIAENVSNRISEKDVYKRQLLAAVLTGGAVKVSINTWVSLIKDTDEVILHSCFVFHIEPKLTVHSL